MNEEILSGLKAARERGFSLEASAQSFINAGYNSSEVKEALSFLSKGFSPLPTAPKETSIPKDAPFAAISPGQQGINQQKPKSSSMTKWIIIVLVLLILLGFLIPMLLFKDRFLNVIDSIFP